MQKNKLLILVLLAISFSTAVFAQTHKEIFEDGVQLFKKGQYQKAIDAFSDLIAVAPDHADAYKNRGVSYMKQKKFNLAIKDFKIAKKLFPELKGLYSNLGVAWYYKKEYEKAIESYDTELEMAPENYVAYFNKALCLAELDKNDEALENLETTLNLKPDFYWAICYKADLLTKKGDTIAAIKTYKEAVKYDSKNAYAKDKLAKIDKTINRQEDKKKPIASLRKGDAQIEHAKEIKETSKNTKPQNLKYAIQTGAFLNKDNAKRMKTKLINMGFDSRVLSLEDSKDKTWHVVRYGNYADKNMAQKDFSLLKEKLGIQPAIRPVGSW